MIRLLIVLFVLALAPLQAATVLTSSWKASTDNGFALQNGTPLAVGNEIRLGAFDFADATLDTEVRNRLNSGNLLDLFSHFIPFDIAHIGTDAFAGSLGTIPLANRAGLFEKSSGPITLSDSSNIFGKQMFMWVFKTTGDNAPASDFSNVTQTGVFSNNTSAWMFPGNSGLAESRPIELTNLTSPDAGTLASTARIIVATGSIGFGTATSNLATGSNKVFELATPIPEPSSAGLLLCMLGTASLIRFGRRRG